MLLVTFRCRWFFRNTALRLAHAHSAAPSPRPSRCLVRQIMWRSDRCKGRSDYMCLFPALHMRKACMHLSYQHFSSYSAGHVRLHSRPPRLVSTISTKKHFGFRESVPEQEGTNDRVRHKGAEVRAKRSTTNFLLSLDATTVQQTRFVLPPSSLC